MKPKTRPQIGGKNRTRAGSLQDLGGGGGSSENYLVVFGYRYMVSNTSVPQHHKLPRSTFQN